MVIEYIKARCKSIESNSTPKLCSKKMADKEDGKSVLFVCLGNICRSPMSEAILKGLVQKRSDSNQWKIDSCGTANYHVGSQPDDRCLATLETHSIHNFKSTVRQLKKTDFSSFKWIFVFDNDNVSDVKRVMPSSSSSKVVLLRHFDPEKEEENPTVIDPYYYDDSYFELCYQQCNRSLINFLKTEFS